MPATAVTRLDGEILEVMIVERSEPKLSHGVAGKHSDATETDCPPTILPIVQQLEALFAGTASSQIAPILEEFVRRRSIMDARTAQPPIADPSLHLLYMWGRLSTRCYHALRLGCRRTDYELLDRDPLLSEAVAQPVEKLLATGNCGQETLKELAVIADDYGYGLRLRGGPFLLPEGDMQAARQKNAASLEQQRKRWDALSALLAEKEREGLSWTDLAQRHGRSLVPLRKTLLHHSGRLAFQAANPLPLGRTGR